MSRPSRNPHEPGGAPAGLPVSPGLCSQGGASPRAPRRARRSPRRTCGRPRSYQPIPQPCGCLWDWNRSAFSAPQSGAQASTSGWACWPKRRHIGPHNLAGAARVGHAAPGRASGQARFPLSPVRTAVATRCASRSGSGASPTTPAAFARCSASRRSSSTSWRAATGA